MSARATSLESVSLRTPTSPRWLTLAVERFDEVLVDHAHCEKKAAANALSFLQAYPEIPDLPAQMARLAREESAHLAKVLALLEERGLVLQPDRGDPYAQRLQELVRKPRLERQLDRFLVAAIIEARSCERLGLLAEGLPETRLRRFYRELAKSEHGHQRLFLRLAVLSQGRPAASERLEVLLDREAEILSEIGIRAAIH